MNSTYFWMLFGCFFVASMIIIAWTSIKFGSADDSDLSSLKGKKLTPEQITKLKKLGLTDEEVFSVTQKER